MAENTPPTPHPEGHGKGIGGFLKQSTAGLPNWAWLLIIAAGIAAAVVIPKFMNQSTTTTTKEAAPPPTDTTSPTTTDGTTTQGGGTVDLSGLTDILKQIQQQTQGDTTKKDTTTTDTTTDTTTKKPPAVPTARTEITSGPGAGAPSIPIRKTPSGTGTIVGHFNFGERITVTGSAVQGTNNFGPNAKAGTGSTLWYPVQGGYVSAFDVKNAGQGSVGPSWPTTHIRSRHMKVG